MSWAQCYELEERSAGVAVEVNLESLISDRSQMERGGKPKDWDVHLLLRPFPPKGYQCLSKKNYNLKIKKTQMNETNYNLPSYLWRQV